MAKLTEEKKVAQEEAERKTDWERQRLEYYRGLRYDFSTYDVEDWLNILFDQQKEIFKPKKNPSWNQVRKEAGLGLLENVNAFIFKEKKKELNKKKIETRKKLQAEVDKANAKERDRCNTYNYRLSKRIENKLQRLMSRNPNELEEYFSFVLNKDYFILDDEAYRLSFILAYDTEKRQLIIDYELPVMDKVSRIKEWKVDKDNNIVPKEMNQAEYLEMYERVIFDLSLRTVGIIFESDSNNLVESIVFNGLCFYNAWQEMPTVLLSFEMKKSQYVYDVVRRMDCVSKTVIAKLKTVKYLGNIESQKPPADLWETPPCKLVVPIKSNL